MNLLQTNFQHDVETIKRISAVTNILDVVCQVTGMGFAAVARVTDKKWIALAVKDDIHFGLLPGGELNLETTICHEIHQHHKAVVIDHVAADDEYASHHTPLLYGFQSYISVPIILKDGNFFGTLCAIDPHPANLKNSRALEMFHLFAELISFHISTDEELQLANSNLREERKIAELREQFIAVLGHDLRNPVNAIANSAVLLQQMPMEAPAKGFLDIIRKSAFRISGLIENILDFARGRMGGGLTVHLQENVQVQEILTQVIAELQVNYPGRNIQKDFHLLEPVRCDGKQIAQLFSNLLGNAFLHGNAALPVIVKAISNVKGFSLSVCNDGAAIPEEVMEHIFQPFYRGNNRQEKKGLGLGLYIASEIARAHGGTLTVTSTDQNTCFLFQLPRSISLNDHI